MSSYCNIDNAYNDNNDELDKMARQINNRKQKLTADVHRSFHDEQKELRQGIESINNNFPEYAYFSTQGDFANTTPTPISKLKRNPKIDYNDDQSSYTSFSDNNSTIDFSVDSPTFDSYIDQAKHDKKNNRMIHNLIKQIKHENKNKHDSDESMFDHVKKCDECKNKLMDLIQHKGESYKKHIQTVSSDESEHFEIDLNKGSTKELLIILLVGVFIIIIMDLLLRSR